MPMVVLVSGWVASEAIIGSQNLRGDRGKGLLVSKLQKGERRV